MASVWRLLLLLVAVAAAAKKKKSVVKCSDDHNQKECNDWADKGECEANPGFMQAKCKHSCLLCTDMDDEEKRDIIVKRWFGAAEAGDVKRLEALKLANGGSCVKRLHPRLQQPALHQVASNGHVAAAEWLIKTCRADPDEREAHYGIAPLHLAAVKGHVGILNLLVSNGANPAPVDEFERTPSDIADSKGHKDFSRALDAVLAFKGFDQHEYSEEYLEEKRMMDEL